jgi:transcription elongation GreA/GreB family factor
MNELKHQLLKYCEQFVEARIASYQNSIHNTQQASNEESKSSAGDKFETSRAMMHIENEQNQKLLSEALQLKIPLSKINPHHVSTQVELGSLVITEQAQYFIAISIGLVKMEQANIFIISPSSPIAQSLMHKKVNDTFTFQQKIQRITQLL